MKTEFNDLDSTHRTLHIISKVKGLEININNTSDNTLLRINLDRTDILHLAETINFYLTHGTLLQEFKGFFDSGKTLKISCVSFTKALATMESATGLGTLTKLEKL